MASPLVAIGTGTTVTFASIFAVAPGATVYQVTSLSWRGISRNEVEATHMATTASPATFGGKVWLPGTIVNCGVVEIEGFLNPDLTPPIEAGAGTLTVTWNGGATWAGSALCNDFGLTNPMEDMIGYTCSFQMTTGVDIVVG